MDRRLAIAIAGGVVLAVGLVGVLLVEADDASDPVLTFPISWSTEEGPPETRSETLDEGENATYAIQIPETNLTHVEARLVWEDDSGDRDRFELAVTPPGGATQTNASRNGTVVIDVQQAPVPTASTVNASDPDAAREQAQRRYASERGQGVWTVRVTLTDAPGQRPVPGAPELEIEQDGSNDFQLRVTYERYTGQIDPRPVG